MQPLERRTSASRPGRHRRPRLRVGSGRSVGRVSRGRSSSLGRGRPAAGGQQRATSAHGLPVRAQRPVGCPCRAGRRRSTASPIITVPNGPSMRSTSVFETTTREADTSRAAWIPTRRTRLGTRGEHRGIADTVLGRTKTVLAPRRQGRARSRSSAQGPACPSSRRPVAPADGAEPVQAGADVEGLGGVSSSAVPRCEPSRLGGRDVAEAVAQVVQPVVPVVGERRHALHRAAREVDELGGRDAVRLRPRRDPRRERSSGGSPDVEATSSAARTARSAVSSSGSSQAAASVSSSERQSSITDRIPPGRRNEAPYGRALRGPAARAARRRTPRPAPA